MPGPGAWAVDPAHDTEISRELLARMDEAATGREHWRILLTSGMGFFTDAYDLFIIGVAAAMIASEWHIAGYQKSLLTSLALLTSAAGAVSSGISPTGSGGGRSTAMRCSCWPSARSPQPSRPASGG